MLGEAVDNVRRCGEFVGTAVEMQVNDGMSLDGASGGKALHRAALCRRPKAAEAGEID